MADPGSADARERTAAAIDVVDGQLDQALMHPDPVLREFTPPGHEGIGRKARQLGGGGDQRTMLAGQRGEPVVLLQKLRHRAAHGIVREGRKRQTLSHVSLVVVMTKRKTASVLP